jgi:hypothetical protein
MLFSATGFIDLRSILTIEYTVLMLIAIAKAKYINLSLKIIIIQARSALIAHISAKQYKHCSNS